MALGTYTTPPKLEAGKEVYAGTSNMPLAAGGGGVATGLQTDFCKWVVDAVSQVTEAGGSVTMGATGFVSAEEAEQMDKDGVGRAIVDNMPYFGFGLAVEVESKDYEGMDGGSDKATEIYRSCGVTLKTSSTGAMFFAPREVERKDDATEVSYGGDVDETVYAAAGGEGSVTSTGDFNPFFFSDAYYSNVDDGVAMSLTGNRALANDVSLWGYIKDAVSSSLRVCASGPNGEFFAWYPDRWGMAENSTPYLVLEDVELIDLTITESDETFYSHVYCNGVDTAGSAVPMYTTQGVISIESNSDATMSGYAATAGEGEEGAGYFAEASDEVSEVLKRLVHIPEGDEWMYTPRELYRRYGARPLNEGTQRSLIESGTDVNNSGDVDFESNPQYIMPFLHALSTFLEKWAGHYTCTLKITFMPNLFPGCRIEVRSLGLSMFVESVSHNMSYTGGFATTVTCSCPIGTLLSGMVNPDYDGDGERAVEAPTEDEE